jgi:transposase
MSPCCARSSVGRWINWFTLSGLEGLQSLPAGSSRRWPFEHIGGNSKRSSLFISLLKHLKATYRRAKSITLIVDNYIIHKSRETLGWLKVNPKFRVIYQPVY